MYSKVIFSCFRPLDTELPFRKPDTYDLFELDKYDHCAYNSILYFLALRVMKKMALLKKDTKTLHDVSEALKRGEKRFDIEFWDEKKGMTVNVFFF